MDDPAPAEAAPPPTQRATVVPRRRGAPVTLFINFDGAELGFCNPSNSKSNCTSLEFEDPIAPYSGDAQQRLAIVEAVRRIAADYGIRVTAQRPPPSEAYTMVVYGGSELDFGVLGNAPAGDCDDELRNQVALAHVDGPLSSWVNGGATTALHEAAHTWGLEHIEGPGSLMFPTGSNAPTAVNRECMQVVGDVNRTPATSRCPEVNLRHCERGDLQNTDAVLRDLLGGPYVDVQAPTVRVVEPARGYVQAPGDFVVQLEVLDDLHPQTYALWAWLDDDGPPSFPMEVLEPSFAVEDLPLGVWTFHVIVADEAGNETQLDFDIEVGLEPPPVDEPPPDEAGCACRVGHEPSPVWLFGLALLAATRRRHDDRRVRHRHDGW